MCGDRSLTVVFAIYPHLDLTAQFPTTVDSLPKHPKPAPPPPASRLWHPQQYGQQQQGTSDGVSPFNSSAGGGSGAAAGLVSPPSLAAGATTPQQQHSVVLVQPSPHRPLPSHIHASRGSSPGPVRAG